MLMMLCDLLDFVSDGCCMLLHVVAISPKSCWLLHVAPAEVPKYSQRLKGSESPPRERRRVSPRPAPQKAPGWTSCEACVMTGDVGVRPMDK